MTGLLSSSLFVPVLSMFHTEPLYHPLSPYCRTRMLSGLPTSLPFSLARKVDLLVGSSSKKSLPLSTLSSSPFFLTGEGYHRGCKQTQHRLHSHQASMASDQATVPPSSTAPAIFGTGISQEPTAGGSASCLEDLRWSPTFTQELPADPSAENRVRQVHGAMFSYVQPTPTGTEPNLVAFSAITSRLIGLQESEAMRPEFAMVFSGNAPIPNTKTYAQCYGGHQFGSWAGQLGDGRAICLGEVLNPASKVRWELQLKGAGKTPYSRMADGRAVLRSSLREFVASEAMAALGIPTTRALSLVATGDQVLRDMFYNGNPRLEPGAVVCRVARSFVRFGSFQLPVSRGDDETKLAKELADHCIRHFYPECDRLGGNDSDESEKYAEFLTAVARRTGGLVAEWTRVGFVHGVLNSDNMSILGDTIDYGPYGWLERFDPDFTPNTTDLPGRRYSFRAQPEIGQWNLLQLARALVLAGLMNEEQASDALVAYGETLTHHYNDAMARKLGLKAIDKELLNDLLKCMYEDEMDYTNTFRALSSVEVSGDLSHDISIPMDLQDAIGKEVLAKDERKVAWLEWLARYRAALYSAAWASEEERRSVQNAANPAIIPRNHVLVEIISAAEDGDYMPLQKYLNALEHPYSSEGLDPAWLVPGPARPRLGVELLSCSS